MALSFCIWGCGFRGKNIFSFMNGRNIRAFVDSNPALWGKCYQDRPIISFNDYLEDYGDTILIVSPVLQRDITEMLDEKGVPYFSAQEMPPEIFSYPRRDLFRQAEKKLNPKGTIWLYGLNIYSLLLAEYLSMNRGRAVRILPENHANDRLTTLVRKSVPEVIGNRGDEIEQTLYITSNKYVNEVEIYQDKKQIYDFLEDIDEYYNPQLEQFRNAHKGRRCFIIATGPSLKIDDLDRLKEHGELCISMNGIFKAYPMTEWRPDYYMLQDTVGFFEWKDELLTVGKVENMLISDYCLGDKADSEFIRYHLSTLEPDETRPPKFTRDFARGAYHSQTITYVCIQFAVYLGCSEIYLYGVDFDYGDVHNHFSQDYISRENAKTSAASNYDGLPRMKCGYEVAKKTADALGIKIYNASRKSKLDVFERVDFDSLFGRREDGKKTYVEQ